MSWIVPQADGIVMRLRIVPRASKNEVCGVLNGALKLRLQAPPVEGKANKALAEFLAGALKVSRGAVTLLSGETGRTKRVAVAGVTESAARNALGLTG